MDRILIVEDQAPVRQWIAGIVRRLFKDADIIETATLQQARENLQQPPDLLLIDLGLPDGRGQELIVEVKQSDTPAPCVVISSFESDSYLFPALKAGADGYLLKDQDEAELSEQLSRIVDGKPPLSPGIADKLFDYFRQPQQRPDAISLSPREQETLGWIMKGYSVKECARAMSISPYTVAEYIKEIYRKLQVNSRGEAIATAFRLGLDRN